MDSNQKGEILKYHNDLVSPPLHYTPDHDGYNMIATNVPQFHDLHDMPIVLDPSRLDEGEGIEQTLRKNKALYHQSCRIMFNNTKLERARKRKATTQNTVSGDEGIKQRRTTHKPGEFECFICESEEPTCELRKAMTMKLNKKVYECAKTLSDGRLLALLSGGDMIAQELKYHSSCLTSLYNRERDFLKNLEKQKQYDETDEKEAFPLAFSELVNYIIQTKSNSKGPTILKLKDMVSLYKQRLQQLGLVAPDVNSTRLKDKLMTEIPGLESKRNGRDILLAFQEDVGLVLSQACDYSEAMTVAKAAKILRRHMLDKKSSFNGTFHERCIEDAIPTTLLQFVGMVEHGADIKSQLRFGVSKTDLTIAQLLHYNCIARYKEDAATHRHSKDRETPFPVYLGLSVFARTRKRTIVEMLHEHGVSVSYDRVLEISAQLGDATVSKYVNDGVVCPPVLRRGLFTTAAMDNIDHNPTATTASTSFHGTSVSLFQHPTKDDKGEECEPLRFGDEKIKKVPELPDYYTNIRPAFFAKKNPPPPTGSVTVPDATPFEQELALEYQWLEQVCKISQTDGTDNLTRTANHASKRRKSAFEVSISSLLPLFREPAHSVATVRHVMETIKETVSFLNQDQTTDLTADQPIYALAKQIQWHWPDEYGKDKFVIMFGGLHIEMAALKSIGTLLQDSGWTGALVEAGVASPGTAESFLTASSITKARQMHQITACSLYQLLKAAYTDYYTEANGNSEELINFEVWCEKRKLESLQLKFWHLILSMELTIFTLVRSFREANFSLYCQALSELIPYFFANNNTNYARWIPVHLRDMVTLKDKHPYLAQEFEKGKFVVHKSSRDFSAMAIDQAHEQANAVIKADGGAIGLTEDPSALRRWMVAGPQVSHLVEQYEALSEAKGAVEKTSHHEQTPRAQRDFLEKVHKLSRAIDGLGNPFQEESEDLMSLDTKDIAYPSAANLIVTHYERGKTRSQEFMEGMSTEGVKMFYEPIKKNRVDFFRQKPVSTDATKQRILKEDCHLFSKLFISCQSRECDLHEFFRHENTQFPASLSEGGKLYTCQKSQLAVILESYVRIPDTEPEGDTFIIDGSALVNSLHPRTSTTFEEYATLIILPTVQTYSRKYQRTDIVFDVYLTSSLKAETRARRGTGGRRRVTSQGKIPRNWQNFLRDNDNKTELFNFLAQHIAKAPMPNIVLVTKEENVVSNSQVNRDHLAPSSHEEADTRMFLHARNATEEGSKVLVVKDNDTDVLVIAISVLPVLQDIGLQQLWIAFGQGQTLKWIPVHDLNHTIGLEKSRGILFFHAFTGCDVVSGFRGKGKKSAWQTWSVYPEVSDTFLKLGKYPPTIDDGDMKILEKFVVLMYDRSSTAACVNDARLAMFARKQRSYETIPPTQGALYQHVKRAAYVAGVIWSQSTLRQPETLTPAEWGWIQKGEMLHISWTTLPSIAETCQQLTKCGCKSECHGGRCKCYRFGLTCSRLCSCRCVE